MLNIEKLARLSPFSKIVGVISLGHFVSHFYFLVIPPLFPVLKEALEVDYTSLGLAITAYNTVAAVAQGPMGFAVDRYNPALVLVGGLGLCSLSVIAIGVFPYYGALIVFMVLLGLGDSVFHPADFTIMNRTVEPHRMGRAFSLHSFAGHLGFAATPVTMITLAFWFGWRPALVMVGVAGLLVAALIYVNRHRLASGQPTSGTGHAEESNARTGIATLFSAPLLLGMVFFAGLAVAGAGIRDFGISTLHVLYDAPLSQAGVVVSAFLFAAPVGVLLGGSLADRTTQHGRVAVVALGVLAAVAFTVAAFTPGLFLVACLFGMAGLCIGAMAPSRDMMIRALTPPEHIGKAFGFVSIGLSIGGIFGPVMFGYLLDHTHPTSVFWITGAFSLLTVLVVLAVGRTSIGRARNQSPEVST